MEHPSHVRSVVALSAALVVGLLGVSAPVAHAQGADSPETPVPAWWECAQGLAFPGPSGEIYGPTAINAQSANQRMAVAFDDVGTITVLRWPRPSFYDQVKHRTSSRDAERFGALPNEGIFLGLSLSTADGSSTVWLRDLEVSQRYVDDRSDAVRTVHRSDVLGLTVTVVDLVPREVDALVRDVTVALDPGSPVTGAALVAFENLNLVTSKLPYLPALDWCGEELNTDAARYDPALGAIVHERSGVDQSTGVPTSVAIAVGFDGAPDGHQVGGDAYEGTAAPDGRVPGPTQDAYDDAADGVLRGNDHYVGQTTGALRTTLDLAAGPAHERMVIAAGPDAAAAAEVLGHVRARPTASLAAGKRAWFDRVLADAPMPATDDPAVVAVARRALVTLLSAVDERSGAVVASIATQSPYGEDWIRDGAFFDHVLDLLGLHDLVAQRIRWYAGLQSDGTLGADNPVGHLYGDATVPPGNWAMNYYADGVVGGPIPWEIDETGYGLWAFWDHYAATGDEEVLADVYPAVRRAADFLTGCVDPRNGLQCVAIEDDNPQPSQTIHGAGPVWLGLDSAVRAARVLGEEDDAARWAARRDELGAAIDEHLFVDGVYGGGNGVIVWPVCFKPFARFPDAHYEAVWDRLAPTFDEPDAGRRERGLYEAKGLIALAKAKGDDPVWRERVRRGLLWIATQHATPDTHIMGEEWLVRDGEVVSAVSQPHIWEQVLFYLAALEAWPPAEAADAEGCGGAIAALRGDVDAATVAADGGGVGAGPAPLAATGGGSLPLAGLGVLLAFATLLPRRRRGRDYAHAATGTPT